LFNELTNRLVRSTPNAQGIPGIPLGRILCQVDLLGFIIGQLFVLIALLEGLILTRVTDIRLVVGEIRENIPGLAFAIYDREFSLAGVFSGAPVVPASRASPL
jgi:hypothetical protein